MYMYTFLEYRYIYIKPYSYLHIHFGSRIIVFSISKTLKISRQREGCCFKEINDRNKHQNYLYMEDYNNSILLNFNWNKYNTTI